MRRLLLALLLSLPALALGAEPKASIVGPTTATVGQPVLLDLGGSASDPEYPLQVEVAGEGDFKPTLRLWYDASQKPGLAVLTAPRAGSYTVVVVAIGKPEGSDKTLTRIAAWPLTVEPIAPAPKPPGPDPVPPDPVPPAPGPITGSLWGVLVLPDLPSVPEAALRTSLAIRSAFAAKNTTFRSYLASESEIQSAGWKAALTAAGGAPAVLWLTDGGKIVKTTAGATEAKILADLKALRGGN
jgi:hypothetical protein